MKRRGVQTTGLSIVLALVAAVPAAVLGLAAVLPANRLSPIVMLAVLIASVGAAAATVVVIIGRCIKQPLELLERRAITLSQTPPGVQLDSSEVPACRILGTLPASVEAQHRATVSVRREIRLALQTGASRERKQRARLETVLRELSEGVVVCDAEGSMLLFNAAAMRILEDIRHVHLGGSVFGVMSRPPLEHALALLRRPESAETGLRRSVEVICPVPGRPRLLRCRIGLLPSDDDDPAFVVAFSDATAELDAERRRDDLLRSILHDFRAPLANIRAAAETLVATESTPVLDRRPFEKVIAEESVSLSDRLEVWADDSRVIGSAGMAVDISSADLVHQIRQRLAKKNGPSVAVTGAPVWLRADTQAVTEFYVQLIHRLAANTGVNEFDIEQLMGDRGVYLDIVWEGQPVGAGILDAWSDEPLEAAVGAPLVRRVLESHRTAIWSQPHNYPGFSLLRLPLPISPRQWETREGPPPPRPEFYDFDVRSATRANDEILGTPLRTLELVAFDTETTGLSPEEGHQIIAIAAVRIANGRIITDDIFDQLVNPGQAIPLQSTRYHGIEDRQVRYKPPIQVVLPKFAEFLGSGAILVGHNAAFDLHFLKCNERKTGVRIRNPVLDVLLLSVFLDKQHEDHTLAAIAERLGVVGSMQRGALEDAMLTAQIYLAMIDLLAERGVHRLGEAMAAAERMLQRRRRVVETG